jgi:rubrerythrin
METLSTPLEELMERLRGQSSRPVGPQPSLSERELLELLESHADHETEALHAYEELAGGSPDEHVRYVASLLLDDERRHHQLLAEMVNRVRSDAEWRPLEPSVPYLGVSHDRAGLLDITAQLMDTERDDLRRVRVLKRRLRRERYQSLLSLGADILEFDTRKHLHILAFLRAAART